MRGLVHARAASPLPRSPRVSPHRAARPIAWAIGGLLLLVGGRGDAQTTGDQGQADEQASTDWPVVIARLRQEMSQRSGQARMRQQLATAYNNYGVQLGEQRQWDPAIQQLQEAIELDAANGQFKSNLSSIYVNQASEAYEHHQINAALEALDKATALAPNTAAAYALRGQIEYDRQRLKEAKAAWQRALELDPTQATLADRLTQVTNELPIESKFERLSQGYFDLRYQEQLESPSGFNIGDVLLEARRSVGSDFAHWPKYKLVVLIYSPEMFRTLRKETPDWVGGQFDGKIRVPLPSAQMSHATVRQILFHEYTHAIIQDLTSGRCPLWLNEGLAEYEGRTQLPGTLKRLKAACDSKRLIPWQELAAHFSTTRSAEEVALAYEESYSVTAYLVKRYGFWRIRRLLKVLADGQPWETALSGEFHLKPAKIEANWRDWLLELLTASP